MTRAEKEKIIEILKGVNVKTFEIEHPSANAVKWYRFGSYMGLRVACDIIKELPEDTNKVS